MRVLVLGSKGQLGRCLSDQLDFVNLDLIFTSRCEIDVSEFLATKKAISAINPNVIINATAYTKVEKAEEDHETANVINHYAVKNIADICSELGIWLVHVSTDYIFFDLFLNLVSERKKKNFSVIFQFWIFVKIIGF